MFLNRFQGHRSPHLLSKALLIYLHVTWTLQDSIYTQRPGNITTATGEPASFHCGIPSSAGRVDFRIQGNEQGNNKTLSCPGNKTHEWPEKALKWSCTDTATEILAIWTITGTSLSDNGTMFRCTAHGQPETVGHLSVFVNSSYFGILIGCVIGGFFGILLVFGLIYVFLQKSESFQECFRGKREEDECTIVEESKGY
ncbi:hypothetical protein AALO_G00182090 [Alosa alosa]|uniref:Ig-like domain-containing protein n=1 Tax=Alosa alosa TaxID=278164 RepID=A0AAV6GC31_9TELE|nr:hypothetical protein AALO_G00182090 [Alosa alosa]